MHEDYDSVWSELEAEAATAGAGGTGGTLIHRLVGATPLTEVHLGIFPTGRLRCCLVRLPEGHHGGPPKLPLCSGLRPGVIQWDELPRPRHFLLLKQEPGSPHDIFGAVAADVCRA